jgi:hypothetical protein
MRRGGGGQCYEQAGVIRNRTLSAFYLFSAIIICFLIMFLSYCDQLQTHLFQVTISLPLLKLFWSLIILAAPLSLDFKYYFNT